MAKKDDNEKVGGCGCLLIIVGAVLIYTGKLLGIAAIIVGVLLFWLSTKAIAQENEEKPKEAEKPRQRPVASVEVTTSHEDDEDEEEEEIDDLTFPIKGINYRDIDDSYIGDFTGTARALRSNPHDPYAVGIYIGSRRVGFIPRGNADVHALIMRNGGSVDASGYIGSRTDKTNGRVIYFGEVTLHPIMS